MSRPLHAANFQGDTAYRALDRFGLVVQHHPKNHAVSIAALTDPRAEERPGTHRSQNAGVALNRRHLLRSVFATAI